MREERATYGTRAAAPETPDFATIALRVITDLEAITGGPSAPNFDGSAESRAEVKAFNAQNRQLITVVAEQLRQIWNARGAADIDAVTDFRVKGLQTEDTHRAGLVRVLRELDR